MLFDRKEETPGWAFNPLDPKWRRFSRGKLTSLGILSNQLFYNASTGYGVLVAHKPQQYEEYPLNKAALDYEAMFKCGGFQSKDFFCVKPLDDKFAAYLGSHDVAERKKLAYEIQTTMLENYYFVPVFRHAFVNAYGPRIKAAKWQDVFPTITTGYAYPWEDIELNA
jgi:ABC-type transport system substrate-binding protein